MDINITMTEAEGRRTETMAISVSEADIRAFVLAVMAGMREAELLRKFNDSYKSDNATLSKYPPSIQAFLNRKSGSPRQWGDSRIEAILARIQAQDERAKGRGEQALRDALRRGEPKADNPGKVPPVDHSTMGLPPGFTAARDFPPGLLEALEGLGLPLEGLAGLVILG